MGLEAGKSFVYIRFYEALISTLKLILWSIN